MFSRPTLYKSWAGYIRYRNVYRLWYVSREYEGELDN